MGIPDGLLELEDELEELESVLLEEPHAAVVVSSAVTARGATRARPREFMGVVCPFVSGLASGWGIARGVHVKAGDATCALTVEPHGEVCGRRGALGR